MIIFKKLWKHIASFASKLTWLGIALVLSLHLIATYLLLVFAGEVDLANDFFYWYFVTASTVGYGDFSPVTDFGKYTTVLFVIPGGILLFSMVIGKFTADYSERVNMKRNGLGNFKNVKDHIVIVADDDVTVKTLDQETNAKLGKTEKVVVSTGQSNSGNWVKADAYTEISAYTRANVVDASRIVVMLDDDQNTLAAVLTLAKLTYAQIVAYFKSQETANLVEGNFDNVECIVSNAAAIVARSMADPGISRVFDALTSVNEGETLYAHHVNENISRMTISDLEEKYNCSVIAIETYDGIEFVNNHTKLNWDDIHTWYYIAKERVQ